MNAHGLHLSAAHPVDKAKQSHTLFPPCAVCLHTLWVWERCTFTLRDFCLYMDTRCVILKPVLAVSQCLQRVGTHVCACLMHYHRDFSFMHPLCRVSGMFSGWYIDFKVPIWVKLKSLNAAWPPQTIAKWSFYIQTSSLLQSHLWKPGICILTHLPVSILASNCSGGNSSLELLTRRLWLKCHHTRWRAVAQTSQPMKVTYFCCSNLILSVATQSFWAWWRVGR